MNPLLFSQTNRENFPVMCTFKEGTNITLFQVSHFALQNTPQNGSKKEAGTAGTEFPPDSLSAPAAFWSRSLGKKLER
jgi:hypothetical protein